MDLVSAGVPASALGSLDGRALTLSSCIELTAAGWDSLPAALGGASEPSGPSGGPRPWAPFATPTRSPPALARALFDVDAGRGAAAVSAEGSPARLALLAEATRAHLEVTAAAAASAAALEEEATARARSRAALAARPARASSRLARPSADAARPDSTPAGGAGGDRGAVLVSAGEGPPPSDGGAPALQPPSAPTDAPSAASEPADAALEEALAALAVAEVAASSADVRARRARTRADDADAALSVSSGSPQGSGSQHSFLGGDPSREQQNIAASAASRSHVSQAASFLNGHVRKFPLLAEALLARADGAAGPSSVGEFSPLVLIPALHAAKQQEHGLLMLLAAARREAAVAGAAGAAAVHLLDDLFDIEASDALRSGAVRVIVAPLDLRLGVLPLAQLAQHLFFRQHAYKVPPESHLIAVAKKLSFVRDGKLDPAGINPLRAAWARAKGQALPIPDAELVFLIVAALARDAEPTYAARTKIRIDGVRTNWTDFAIDTVQTWQRGRDGRDAAAAAPTSEDLQCLMRRIADFAQACLEATLTAGSLYPPTPGFSLSFLRVVEPPPLVAGPSACVVSVSQAKRAPRSGKRHGGGPAPSGPPVPPATPPAPPPVAPSVEPASLLIPVLVVDGSRCILSTTPLVAAGWVITLSEDAAGSHLTIPGAPRRVPLLRDASGNYYVTFVARHGGLALRENSAAHRALLPYHFLLDTGAEISVVGMNQISLLRELGSRPIPLLHTVAGPPVPVLETGNLLLIMPAGAAPPPAPREPPTDPAFLLTMASDGGPGWTSDGGPGWTAVRTGSSEPSGTALAALPSDPAPPVGIAALRPSAFPPIKKVQQLADRFNLSTAPAVLAFLGATRLGLAPDLASQMVAGTDYSQGYLPASQLKAPPVHAARDVTSAAFRDAAPPGSIWWTDVSNTRPEDFEGNVVSRLFSEERTGYAITYYSARKDSATLVEQIAELAAWVAANVPGGELRMWSGATSPPKRSARATAMTSTPPVSKPSARPTPGSAWSPWHPTPPHSTAAKGPGAGSTVAPCSTHAGRASAPSAGASWSAGLCSSTTTPRPPVPWTPRPGPARAPRLSPSACSTPPPCWATPGRPDGRIALTARRTPCARRRIPSSTCALRRPCTPSSSSTCATSRSWWSAASPSPWTPSGAPCSSRARRCTARAAAPSSPPPRRTRRGSTPSSSGAQSRSRPTRWCVTTRSSGSPRT